ncbi:hypothetical protein QUF80_18540 [Desulfococcaceae bacterium HSG8]|nr:hypothetical protein [Desulfococcaceae bacterium HSG8]
MVKIAWDFNPRSGDNHVSAPKGRCNCLYYAISYIIYKIQGTLTIINEICREIPEALVRLV